MTSEIPQFGDEDQSFFTRDPKLQRDAEISSPVSPHTKRKKRPLSSQRRSHLSPYRRSRSDHEYTQAKVSIPTISAHNSIRLSHVPSRPEPAPNSHDNSLRHSQDDDSQSTAGSLGYCQRRQTLGSFSSYSPHQAKPGHNWRRTHSGGVWYQCEQSSGRNSKKSSRSSGRRFRIWTGRADEASVNASQGVEGSESPKPPIEHPVLIRTGPSEDNVERANKSSADGISRDRAKALDILISPLTYLRRLSIRPKRHSIDNEILPSASPQLSKLSRSPVAHRSAQKHALSKKALSQVSVILQNLTIERASRPLSNAPTTSAGSPVEMLSGTRNKKRRAITLPSPITLYVKKPGISAEANTISVTSSVEDFKQGLTPRVTPDEGATYKIKRSPSADTQTYLKVDISIRGGTNYLPSEARRIHTPPLPEDSHGSRRRGYFFDYYDPQNTMKEDGTHRHPQRTKINNQPRKDWYDMELDRLDGDEADWQPVTLSTRGWINDDERLDHDIPEHLPTSPLCPRHPRYWRVVDGKGSQFRGCWMHGIGVNETMGGMKRNSSTR